MQWNCLVLFFDLVWFRLVSFGRCLCAQRNCFVPLWIELWQSFCLYIFGYTLVIWFLFCRFTLCRRSMAFILKVNSTVWQGKTNDPSIERRCKLFGSNRNKRCSVPIKSNDFNQFWWTPFRIKIPKEANGTFYQAYIVLVSDSIGLHCILALRRAKSHSSFMNNSMCEWWFKYEFSHLKIVCCAVNVSCL